ncbi:hypothetical protein AMK31_35635 [Streptomyces sp. TSRI0107]|nr:hypothetical protein AMK31_35635 [Streptomyces sp. TSRI0107]
MTVRGWSRRWTSGAGKSEQSRRLKPIAATVVASSSRASRSQAEESQARLAPQSPAAMASGTPFRFRGRAVVSQGAGATA